MAPADQPAGRSPSFWVNPLFATFLSASLQSGSLPRRSCGPGPRHLLYPSCIYPPASAFNPRWRERPPLF